MGITLRLLQAILALGVFLGVSLKAHTAFGVVHLSSIGASNDYKKVQLFLRGLKSQYPQSTEIFSIGTSGTGESIDGLKIGHGAVKNLIVATHHGNEYGSTEVALAVAEDLAKNPISHRTIYVIPVLNISGYNINRRDESVKGTSSSDVADANRDYPGPCGSEGPFKLKSTKALADFVDREEIVVSATLHTFYPAVVYPWGFGTPDLSTPYDSLYIDLSKMATVASGYQVGNSSEVIYPANGTFEDYVFWKHGIWSLLFELGESHHPTDASLKKMVAANVPGLRKLMENAPTSRAPNHEFKGRCDAALRRLDRHDE